MGTLTQSSSGTGAQWWRARAEFFWPGIGWSLATTSPWFRLRRPSGLHTIRPRLHFGGGKLQQSRTAGLPRSGGGWKERNTSPKTDELRKCLTGRHSQNQDWCGWQVTTPNAAPRCLAVPRFSETSTTTCGAKQLPGWGSAARGRSLPQRKLEFCEGSLPDDSRPRRGRWFAKECVP